ncbi:MAG: AMP-binding protein [Chitinophagales bacterium]
MTSYQDSYRKSIDTKEEFWANEAKGIQWNKIPKNILSQNEEGLYEWFADGELNMSALCLDFHIKNGRGDQTAIIYDSAARGIVQKISYSELKSKVAKFAGALQSLGVQKEDTVVIYMPMIPEAIVAMLSAARIGAVHSVVFCGFSPHELSIRKKESKTKMIN